MSPVDFVCLDCGAAFAIGVSRLSQAGADLACPDCDSREVGADLAAIARRDCSVDRTADPAEV
jgi:DNA-directed RNA polymerase subunit RPC12/RpoP